MPPLVHSKATSLLAPRCLACCQRLSRVAGLDGVQASRSGLFHHQIQIRGKKSKPQPPTSITVKLIADLEGYGPKGTIVAVPIGQMRNVFYPGKIASYLSVDESRAVKSNRMNVQRDSSFGVKPTNKRRKGGAEVIETEEITVEQPARHPQLPDAVRADLRILKPQDAFQLLSDILPPVLTFYRATVVPTHSSRPADILEDVAASSTWSSKAPKQATSIYGSVSTADVVNNIRVLVDSSDIKGRIALDESDVQFVKLGEASDTVTATAAGAVEKDGTSSPKSTATAATTTSVDRVKQLGDFELDIKIKGHNELIRRIVSIRAENESPPMHAEQEEEPVAAAVEELKRPVHPTITALSGLAAESEIRKAVGTGAGARKSRLDTEAPSTKAPGGNPKIEAVPNHPPPSSREIRDTLRK